MQAAQSDSTYIANDADSITYMTTVEASRGNILDRNGNVLISNRASYNLVIINFVLFNSKTPNESLLRVLELCDEQGVAYQSHFPVTATRPYTLTVDEQSSTWQGYYRAFLANRDYDADISAQTLMKNLMQAYRIPDDWTQEPGVQGHQRPLRAGAAQCQRRGAGKLHARNRRAGGAACRRDGAGRAGRHCGGVHRPRV